MTSPTKKTSLPPPFQLALPDPGLAAPKESSRPPMDDYVSRATWGADFWGEDVFGARPLWRPRNFRIPAARMGIRPLAGPPMQISQSKPTLGEFIVQLTNEIHSLDLDFRHVPTNRGTGLCRFSEFTPRDIRPEKCSVKIFPNTQAHVYGEIRPVKGKDFSIINRWTVHYTPHVVSLASGVLPDLEIQGFAAVDTPKMVYDKSFKKRQSVLKMTPADFEYENPLETGGKYQTPFGKAVAPPPSGGMDWMIRFSPANDTLVSNLMEAGADSVFDNEKGRGRLMLWPFLATLGLYGEKPYKDLGIKYLTFPRRLGDLISLFYYLGGTKGKQLRESAPFINPNSEYIDYQGKRQRIPEDAREVVKINKRRKAKGLPLLGRNRGTIVDWYFRDLLNDPNRLLKMKAKDLPYGNIHIKLRATTLKTPLGTVEVKEATDLRAKYYLWRRRNKDATKLLDRGLGVRLKAVPLDLGKIDLELQSVHLKANSLRADWANIKVPSLRSIGLDLIEGKPKGNAKPVKVVLRGVHAENLVLHDSVRSFDVVLGDAEIKEVIVTKLKNGVDLSLNGITAHNVDIDSAFGNLSVKTAELPYDPAKKNPKRLELKVRMDEQGRPKFTQIKIPKIQSSGGFKLKQRKVATANGNPIPFNSSGSSTIEDFYFTNRAGPTHAQIETGFKFSGAIESARTQFEPLGAINFSTIEEKPDQKIRHSVSGSLSANIRTPNDPKADRTPADYTLKIQLPYVGFTTQGRFKVPTGKAALRDAYVKVKPGFIEAEGDLDLSQASLLGLGEKATKLGRMILPIDSPQLEDFSLKGRARFQLSEAGWSLERVKRSGNKLTMGMKVKDSRVEYEHDLLEDWVGKLPAAKVIESWAEVEQANVELEDFQSIKWQRNPVNEKGEVVEFKTGPFTIHDVKGKGVVWAPLALWGYVRGLFPAIGGSRKKYPSKLPSADPLVKHLPNEVQKKLKKGDFFRLGGLSYEKASDGSWEAKLNDLLVRVHEQGGRWQFGMIRVPSIKLVNDGSQTTREIPGDFLTNIYLNDPDRGGYFRIVRWPTKP